ncbi:MAG TPA: ferritin-like domain-containing protein [Chloroflexota bacterium]
MEPRDVVVAWLNDAHAMENALIRVLEHRVDDAKDYPWIQARDQQHLDQTRRHADMVKSCVDRLGGKTSTIKSTLASLFGTVQAPTTGPAGDEIVKNFLTDYAAESFEVASYRALITAATEIGDRETATVCEQILAEDQDMANWLIENLPVVTREQMIKMVGAGQRS